MFPCFNIRHVIKTQDQSTSAHNFAFFNPIYVLLVSLLSKKGILALKSSDYYFMENLMDVFPNWNKEFKGFYIIVLNSGFIKHDAIGLVTI